MLGAGGSKRLGRPKQLLPYGDGTLLGHVVGVARACPFDQIVVAIGGAADDVRATVDLTGADVVVNDAYGAGCSSSIAAALDRRRPALRRAGADARRPARRDARTRWRRCWPDRGDAPLAVCRYDDGRGHPIAFARSAPSRSSPDLHGDKGVWRLLDQRADDVAEVPIAGPIPPDVDTQEDYEAVLAAARAGG